MSKIIESLRGDMAALHRAGAIGKVTMREFDAICPPPVREFSAEDIKRLREALKFSQPVFALHLHTSASTVRAAARPMAADWSVKAPRSSLMISVAPWRRQSSASACASSKRRTCR